MVQVLAAFFSGLSKLLPPTHDLGLDVRRGERGSIAAFSQGPCRSTNLRKNVPTIHLELGHAALSSLLSGFTQRIEKKQ
jgi:hypothetical protein